MAQSFSVKAVLQAIDENFTSTTEKAMQTMNKLGATSNSVSNSVAKNGSGMSGTFKSVAGGMGLVAVASKAFDVVKGSVGAAVSRIDTLNNSNRTFANMGFSANQTKSAMNGLQSSIKGLPTSLDSAVKGVQMISASTGNLGKSQKVWSALNDSIIGFGGSTADVSNATIQLSQAFANGKIDGMTWISMMNSNMGPVLNAIAKKLGMTTGQLKDGLASGKISTNQFMDALISLDKNGGGGLKSLHQIAMDSTAGIGTAMENMKTAVVRGVGKAILAFSNFSKNVTGMSIAEIITNIGNVAEQSLNKIGPALQKTEPFFKSLFSTIQGLFNFVNQNKDWLGPLTIGIGGGIASFIALNKAIAIAKDAWVGAQAVFNTGKALIGIAKGSSAASSALTILAKDSKVAAAAQAVLNAVAELNPYVLIATAIIAVSAALVWFFTQTKTGQKLWQGFTQFLSNAWQGLVSIAQSVWSAIVSAFTTVVGVIKGVWSGITGFFSGLWQGIVSIATTVWNSFIASISPIVEAFKTLWSSLTEFFSTLWQGIVSIAKTIWSGLSAFFSTIWQGIVAVATPIWNSLVAVITTVWNIITTVIQTAITVISTVIQTVLTVIQTVWSTIWNVIVTVVQTVWNMVVTVISTAINVVASIIQAITQAIQGNWSAVWNTIVSIATTVWNGIKSVVSAGINGVQSVITSVMNGLKSVISTVWNTIKGIFNAGVNFIKSVVHIDLGAQGRAIIDSFLNGLKSAWEAVKSFVGGIASWIKKHKGPISYDRKLLIPAGIAIMTGFNKGLQDQFSTVQKGVSNMAGAVSDAVSSNLETITVPSPNTRDFMNTMNALQSANQNLYRQHSVGFGGTFSDNLTIDSPTMAQENNSLLRKLADKKQDIYLDGNVLVGGTYDRYNHAFGNGVNLQGRWN